MSVFIIYMSTLQDLSVRHQTNQLLCEAPVLNSFNLMTSQDYQLIA